MSKFCYRLDFVFLLLQIRVMKDFRMKLWRKCLTLVQEINVLQTGPARI